MIEDGAVFSLGQSLRLVSVEKYSKKYEELKQKYKHFVKVINNFASEGKAWFPHGRKNRVTIFLNGQFIIVYTCKPHINHKYSLVLKFVCSLQPGISIMFRSLLWFK
jgi:hypothetical protein